jgi:hypothetical protein
MTWPRSFYHQPVWTRWHFGIGVTFNPLTPNLGGKKETQRGFALLHAPVGTARYCGVDKAKRNPSPPSP